MKISMPSSSLMYERVSNGDLDGIVEALAAGFSPPTVKDLLPDPQDVVFTKMLPFLDTSPEGVALDISYVAGTTTIHQLDAYLAHVRGDSATLAPGMERAAEFENPERFHLFCDHGADPLSSKVALVALRNGRVEALEHLRDGGFDFDKLIEEDNLFAKNLAIAPDHVFGRFAKNVLDPEHYAKRLAPLAESTSVLLYCLENGASIWDAVSTQRQNLFSDIDVGVEILAELEARGVDLSERDATLFFEAVMVDNSDVVQGFIDRGITPSAGADAVLRLAINNSAIDAADTLVDNGYPISPEIARLVDDEVRYGRWAVASWFFDHGCFPELSDCPGAPLDIRTRLKAHHLLTRARECAPDSPRPPTGGL